jgi:Fe-S-cluster-containing hydrogenase component 2
VIKCDIRLCVGCRICEVTCSAFHFGAVSPALSRIRVAKLEEIGIDMAVACVSCAEKSCLVCPTDALTVGEEGEIALARELCTSCQECVSACPVGAVGFYEDLPLFCDLCDGDVSCVRTCPTDALAYVDKGGESLEAFAASDGNPAEKRAAYVEVQGVPLRDSWAAGQRVDS